MKRKRISEAIGNINQKYINEASTYGIEEKHKTSWLGWSSIAACFALIVALSIFLLSNNQEIPISRIQSSIYGYDSITKLYEDADLVVVASPDEDFVKRVPCIKKDDSSFGGFSDFYTIGNYTVEKVFKGTVGKQIKVIEPAAIITQGDLKVKLESSKVLMIIGSNYTVMEKGKKYMLFLKKNDELESYGLMSLEYGKYNVDGTDLNEEEFITEERASDVFKIKQEVLKAYEDGRIK